MITIPDTKYLLTKLSEFILLKFAMLILAFHMLKLAKLILRAIYLEAFIYMVGNRFNAIYNKVSWET